MTENLDEVMEGYQSGRLSRRQVIASLGALGIVGSMASTAVRAATGEKEKPSLGELLPQMLGKQFYLCFMKSKGAMPPMSPRYANVLVDHLLFLHKLEEEGVLFMAGPLRDQNRPGDWDGSGIVIVRANYIEEVQALFEKEPFTMAGMRENTFYGWQLNEGHLNLSIQLSQKSFDMT